MRSFFIILIVVLLAIVVNLPASFQIQGTTYYRPQVHFNIGSLSIDRDMAIKLGLDLSGGAHLVYEADTTNLSGADADRAVESTRANIERRVNSLGVSEPVIQTSKVGDKHRLIVELAGVTDISQAERLIGQTAKLEFRESTVATPSAATDFSSTGLSGSDLKLAQVQFGNGETTSSEPVVSIEFTPDGAKKFADITSRNVGRALPVFLDDQLITAPVVQTQISDGRAIVSGGFTLDDAKRLVIQLNAGALPIPIKIVEQRNVGATLGQESIIKSVVAGAIGLLLVWLFMVANYGFKGLVANFALLIYVLLSLAIIRVIPITLTLAGIAGLILSIGMALDANILIFERIKEEMSWGRPLAAALQLGFHRASSSIRDSNVSTLITCAILFWFGSGPVRGFALTLAVGVVTSLFTAIFVTRTLLKFVYRKA